MLFYWLLVRRDLTRAYEYTAIIGFLGMLSVGCLWAFPAVGPWEYFQGQYESSPAMPSYLPALHALKENQHLDDGVPHGFLNFPSFHAVFALLIIYAMRGTGALFWLAVVLNVAVIIATVPVGMHYLVDIPGGMLFTAFGIYAIRRATSWLISTRRRVVEQQAA